jgi:hypothetical protein
VPGRIARLVRPELGGPLGFNRQLNRNQTVAAIGDIAFSAILGWHEGEHHWNMAVASENSIPSTRGQQRIIA